MRSLRTQSRRTHRTWWFVLGGLAVALVLAGIVSNVASSAPDGLAAATREGCTVNDKGEITGGTCIAQAEQDHELSGGPLADYGIRGVDNGFLSTGLAGVLGVLVTFAVGGLLFRVLGRRRPAPAEPRPHVGSDG